MASAWKTRQTVGLLLVCGAAACAADSSGRSIIRITGSDTMVNLVQAWAEHYRHVRPADVVYVSGGGSGVGLAGLVDGTVDVAAASREIKTSERARARERRGAPVRESVVAADALAIYVHAGNPISSIALTDLAEIFGEHGAIETWPALGVLNSRCRGGRVIRVGRQSNSGTFTYFHHIVLGSTREYKMGSIDQNGSKDVVALISRTPCAIGYSGIAYATDGVRAVAVRSHPDAPAILPSERSVVDGTYPLARPLYLYTAGNAPRPVSDFIDWVLGPSGQAVVHALGFVPATALSGEGEP